MHSAEDLYTESDDLEIVHEPQNEAVEHEQGSGDENAAGDENETTRTVVKPKRVIRNPQPKLDAEALKGPKGLLCLEGYFKNKKYRGKGHEDEDLRSIMKTYEYWCHRLFPKYPFDECITKLEKLGTKKAVQTYVKKIRMNLVEEEERRILSDDDDRQPVETVETQFTDLVLQETRVDDEASQLTEDQLERIRLNKEKANQLRLERLQRAKQKAIILTNTSGTLEKTHGDASDFDVIRENETVTDEYTVNENVSTNENEVDEITENFRDEYNDEIELAGSEVTCDMNVNHDNEFISPGAKINEDIATRKSNGEITQNAAQVGTLEKSVSDDALAAEDGVGEFPIAMDCD